MKNVRVVIIGFAGFAVLAVVVLGYGLYRKGSASAALDDRLAEADQVLRTDLADFVAMDEAERKLLVARARKIQRQLAADPKAPPSKAALLGEMLARCASARAEIQSKQRELTRMRRALSYLFPDDKGIPATRTEPRPTLQIAPGKRDELRGAIRAARKVAPELTVDVDGRSVDLTPAFEQDLAAIRELSALAAEQLDKREQAFRTFLVNMREVLRTGGVKEAAKRAGDFDAWFLCVVSCPQQRRVLELLEGMISRGSRQGDPKQVARVRADRLLRSLRSPSLREKQIALTQYDGIVMAAQLAGVDAKVLAELAKAREAFDQQRKASQDALALAEQCVEQMEQALLKIAPWAEKTTSLRKKGKIDTDAEIAWVSQCAAFDDEVDKTVLDAGLKAFLKQAMRHANPAPPARPKPPKTIRVYKGPDWGMLAPSFGKLDQLQAKHRKLTRQESQQAADVIGDYVKKARAFQANIDRQVKARQPVRKRPAIRPATQPASGPAGKPKPAPGKAAAPTGVAPAPRG